MGVRSLHEFFKEEKEVWVQNVTSPQGNIVITIDQETNESISIPKGTDPIALTERFTFERLKKCTELRRLVEEKRFLILLTQEEADAYYKKSGKNPYKVKERQATLQEKKVDFVANEQPVANTGVVSVTEVSIPPRVLSLEAEYSNKIITDEKYVEELSYIESDLNNEETMAFISSKTKGSKLVKKFIENLNKKNKKD